MLWPTPQNLEFLRSKNVFFKNAVKNLKLLSDRFIQMQLTVNGKDIRDA